LLSGLKCVCSTSLSTFFFLTFLDLSWTLDYCNLQISSRNLDRVRKLKSAMTRLTARVQKVSQVFLLSLWKNFTYIPFSSSITNSWYLEQVRDELEQLLDDDDDMADLYLSRKAGSSSPVSGTGASNWFASSPTLGSRISRASRASLATVRLDENDVEELEMLLEVINCTCFKE